MNSELTKDFVTQKDAAKTIMVSTGTIRKLIDIGELEAYRFGKQVRITKESLCNFITKNKISH